MSLRKTFFFICLTVSVLCLAAGYGLAGQWTGVILASLLAPAWLFAQKHPDSRLSLVCLLLSVGLAAAGMLLGSSPYLMMFGSATALAVWDLVLLHTALGNQETGSYEYKHLRSLALALGIGLLASVLGRFLKIQIPFLVLMLSITFILFALDRVWGYIKRAGDH